MVIICLGLNVLMDFDEEYTGDQWISLKRRK